MLWLTAILLALVVLVWLWGYGFFSRFTSSGEGATAPTEVQPEQAAVPPAGDTSGEKEKDKDKEEKPDNDKPGELDVGNNDNPGGFVDHIIIRGDSAADCVNYSIDALATGTVLAMDSEVVLWQDEEKVIYRTVEEIIRLAAAGGSGAMIPLWRDGRVDNIRLEQFRLAYPGRGEERLAVLGKEPVATTTTVDKVVSTATTGDTVCLTDSKQEALPVEVIVQGYCPLDGLYYARTVSETDIQGLWGIIHSGIIEEFEKGVELPWGKALPRTRCGCGYHATRMSRSINTRVHSWGG